MFLSLHSGRSEHAERSRNYASLEERLKKCPDNVAVGFYDGRERILEILGTGIYRVTDNLRNNKLIWDSIERRVLAKGHVNSLKYDKVMWI